MTAWELCEWRYDGQMNAEHFSGELGFQVNGTELQIVWRTGGRVFSATVRAEPIRDILTPSEGPDRRWMRHGAWVKLTASGYAPDGRLRLLEPDCHLRWTDNYPEMFGGR